MLILADAVTESLTWGAGIFLVLAVGLALAFEFVNGFHDTANAVATVIYTHTLKPNVAVVWSGCWNLIGVLTSSGAVAFGILALLPVELVVNVGSGPGFAMVFALLISAILWNLGTWYLGLPASSSHTLIGSIMGVGLANAMMKGNSLAEGVNWTKAGEVFLSLLVSPVVGFACAAGLLLIAKRLIKNAELFKAPPKDQPPPRGIRALLILTCTGVSFAHGSNDGQKGMGLILLILIGILPGVYALNMDTDAAALAKLQQTAVVVEGTLATAGGGSGAAAPAAPAAPSAAGAPAGGAGEVPSPTGIAPPPGVAAVALNPTEADEELTRYLKPNGGKTAQTLPALAAVNRRIAETLAGRQSLTELTTDQRRALRVHVYVAGEAIAKLTKKKEIVDPAAVKTLADYKTQLSAATNFIPGWVKLATALALGVGTMIGWKRIVVTVGEKIGKDHLTYAQGASAELVAMVTIGAADVFGLPVSTTHVLSSGVAGTMAANKSGLQVATLRNMLMAWVLTLPVCVLLGAFTFAAGLYIVLNNLVPALIGMVSLLVLLVVVWQVRRMAAAKAAAGAGDFGQGAAGDAA